MELSDEDCNPWYITLTVAHDNRVKLTTWRGCLKEFGTSAIYSWIPHEWLPALLHHLGKDVCWEATCILTCILQTLTTFRQSCQDPPRTYRCTTSNWRWIRGGWQMDKSLGQYLAYPWAPLQIVLFPLPVQYRWDDRVSAAYCLDLLTIFIVFLKNIIKLITNALLSYNLSKRRFFSAKLRSKRSLKCLYLKDLPIRYYHNTRKPYPYKQVQFFNSSSNFIVTLASSWYDPAQYDKAR